MGPSPCRVGSLKSSWGSLVWELAEDGLRRESPRTTVPHLPPGKLLLIHLLGVADAASKVMEQEWREKAKKDLEEWNQRQSEQVEKNKINNR